MKKKLTILFGDAHLSYSPTAIGLYDLLSQHFDVTIVARSPKFFDDNPLADRNVVYIKQPAHRIGRLQKKMSFKLASVLNQNAKLLAETNAPYTAFYEFRFIEQYLSAEKPDIVIAVDFKSLFFAQMLALRVEFVSLEIVPNDPFHAACDLKNINSVVIQTKERYEHLFGEIKFKTFYIQNAPIYVPVQTERLRAGLVYCGTAWNPFGFYHCLALLREFPELALNVRGAILHADKKRVQREYGDLLANGRLIIDDEYLDDKKVVDYLRRFRIGFSFYNFEVDWIDNFNYYSAPSGKMFKYFAAGVPVVALDTLGAKPVAEFDCGVLINDLKPENIKQAVDNIENNFEYYSQNCLKAAENYSFDKMAQPFVEYLLSSVED
jgi:glycosyltransferase involved in cell wall biosynthesis